MFALLRVALRSFGIGVVVGVLFAPRAGAETRRMLSAKLSRILSELFEIVSLPPVAPERARTNGHAERPAPRRARTSTDAPAS